MKPAFPALFARFRHSLIVPLAFSSAALLPHTAQAQKYWTNNLAGSYNLSTASNWEDAAALDNTATDIRFFRNVANDDLTLDGAFTITNDVTGLALNRLDLDGQSATTGRSVTLSGNAITLNSGAQLTLGNQASSGGNAFGYTISAPVTLSGNLTVTGSPANTPGTGAASFSAVTLPVTAAAFTYDSTPRINFSGVSLDADHSFAGNGAGGITFGGTVTLTGNRTFNVTGSSTPALGGTITDGENSYSITKTGSGLLSLAGANHTFDGGVTVQGGTLGLTAAAGTVNHSPGGVFVQNGATVRLDWSGTPSGPVVATAIDFGAGGGLLEFGATTGNPVTVTQSGNVTGSGPLKLLARGGNKDSIVFSGENSAYSGAVSIESATPANLLQLQAVIFNSTTARFGSASTAVIAVKNGGRVGFTGSVTTSDLAPFSFSGNSGIVLAGSAGAFDSAIADPFALIPATGGIVLNNRDNLSNDRWPDSAPVALVNQSFYLAGRNANNNLTNETVGALSFAGGSRVTLDMNNSTNSGVKVTAASLGSPAAGTTLLFDVNDTSDQWGTTNGLSQLIVTGTKPTVTNGMVSPGIQYYPGGNTLGFFMTFDGDNLDKASATSTDITTAGTTDIVNIGAAAQTLDASKTVHAVRTAQNLNLGGFTLTLGSGGFMTSSNTTSNGTLDFGGGPGFIGAYNAASQAHITASITGSGGITVVGTSQSLNLNTGTNTFTGGLFINGGSVALSNNAANLNDVTVNPFGRLMALKSSSPTVNHNPNIGGLSGTGRVAPWFQDSTPAQSINITPATSTTHTFDGFFTNGDAGRVLNLVKNGEGTQVISNKAAASHTGALTVNDGTLLLDADFTSATGLATVGASGTFGGSGKLGGSATVNDGGKLAFVINSAPAGHDKLDITGGLTFEGSAVTINITSPGGITAGNYTLATATGGITGTPTFTCNMPAGWSGTATISGTDLVLTVSATGSTPYDDWADSFPGFTSTDPALDPDNDGLENLLEFVLGGDPRVSQPGILPAVTSASGSDLVITFQRSDDSEAQPVTVKVQVSTDLATWNPADDILIEETDGSGPNGATYTVVENAEAPDTVTVTIPKAAAAKKFARVVASE